MNDEIPPVPPLDPATAAKVRDLARVLREDLDLHGPWRWIGNSRHGNYHLATRARGRQFVLGFTWKRREGSQPLFRVRPEGERWSVMKNADDLAVRAVKGKADDLAIHEVCPEATDRTDPRLYRHDVIGFRSPVAEWMATVTPDVVLALLDALDASELRTASTASSGVRS